MTENDYTQLRNELKQMRLEPTNADRKSPVFDFGLFVLLYFFALALVDTLLLLVGLPIQGYSCLLALPFAWFGVMWYRNSALYALAITLGGALFLAACALLAGQFFDVAWDSNCYHKPITGLLANGWNPFRQTLISFANSSTALPYNPDWETLRMDIHPKATYMIGASFYALTGNIAYAKVFNLAGMVAAACIVTPLLRDALRMNFFAALACVLFALVNPITLAQVFTFYNDGFVFQLLTVASISLAYMAFIPEGRYARAAMAAVFVSICLAANVAMASMLFSAVICLFYYIVRLVAIAQTGAEADERRVQHRRLFLYFVSMALCSILVLGASTYVLNLFRHGNLLYGMPGSASGDTNLTSMMSIPMQVIPKVAQVFTSLFSQLTNNVLAGGSMKIPFSITAAEWAETALDTNVSGWGVLFSGIFLVSLIVVLRAIYLLNRLKARKVKLLVVILFTVFFPVLFIPYLYSARYYLQLFWLPMAALLCLFAPYAEDATMIYPSREAHNIPFRLLGVVLCLLLVVNGVTAYNYLDFQLTQTRTTRATLAAIQTETENNNKVLDVSTASDGLFYGLFFNLQDEGITDYNFASTLADIHGNVLYYLPYNLRNRGTEARAEAYSFLYSLNMNGYLVVIAKQGAAGALDSRMITLLDTMLLEADGHDAAQDNYLAVIDSNAHIRTERSGTDPLTAELEADSLAVRVISSSARASITIDGTQYALASDGYNIVVFDSQNDTLIDSVVIDTGATPVLSR